MEGVWAREKAEPIAVGSNFPRFSVAHQVPSKLGAKLHPCRRFRRVPNKAPRITLELAIVHCLGVLNTHLFLTGRPQITAEVEVNFPEEADMVTIEPTSDDIQ